MLKWKMKQYTKSVKKCKPAADALAGEGIDISSLPLQAIELDKLAHSPENDEIYKAISNDDPQIKKLAQSIRDVGVLTPALVGELEPDETQCGKPVHFILSGNRRMVAAKLAYLGKLPCQIVPLKRADDAARWLRLLVAANTGTRVKDFRESINELKVITDSKATYESLKQKREEITADRSGVEFMTMGAVKARDGISAGKRPFAAAVIEEINRMHDYWPLSIRQLHYLLLNLSILRNSQSKLKYQNDTRSYKDLSDICTRLRAANRIIPGALDDSTRPVFDWKAWSDPAGYVEHELKNMLLSYQRNLQQSQPAHLEIFIEKRTQVGTLKPIAKEYAIPLSAGNGQSSYPVLEKMAARFNKSGKQKLAIFLAGDFDADGMEISRAFVDGMRRDFRIENIQAIRFAINASHVEKYNIPRRMIAKESSSNHDKFVAAHGKNVWELEALTPQQLQDELRTAIESYMDMSLFKKELAAEEQDSLELANLAARVRSAMALGGGK